MDWIKKIMDSAEDPSKEVTEEEINNILKSVGAKGAEETPELTDEILDKKLTLAPNVS